MPQHKTLVKLAIASLLLAILAEILLTRAAWGINFGLFALAVSGAVVWLSRGTGHTLSPNAKLFGTLCLVFASLFGLHDADGLKIANGIALTFCLGSMLLSAQVAELAESRASRLLVGPIKQVAMLVVRFSEFRMIKEAAPIGPSQKRQGAAVAKGLVMATPLVLVFGGLFSSADAVFRTKVTSLFSISPDFALIGSNLGNLLTAMVLVGGLLCAVFLRSLEPASSTRGVKPRISGIEAGIVFGALNLLFLAFIIIQFRYLFGSRDVVRATHGLSYAEYARGGFFELLCVAGLALLVLLTTDSLLDKSRRNHALVFRWLGRSLVAMVFCVLASATMRMKLYTDAFGLTELRVYTSVFMVWLALAFAWMLVTVLVGRSQRFAFGALVAGLFVIFCLNLANPEAIIARVNLQHATADMSYLATLSDDAVLAIAQIGDAVPKSRRTACDKLVSDRRAKLAHGDWREENATRWQLSRG